jgi:uncharacterized oxidoreductase
MDLASNSVLVTGGGSGIGLALAVRFLAAGSQVLICGRREEALRQAQAAHPGLEIAVCDVASAAARQFLIALATERLPGFNVLVNNAGVQHRLRLTEPLDWEAAHAEIAINFEAVVELSSLSIPHFRGRQRAAILNVSSGLAFVPLVSVPIYSATKAAVHSFTLALRHQLKGTSIEVVEIVPPAVNTDLGGPGLHTFGVAVDEFADEVMARLGQGESEIAYGFSEQARLASRAELAQLFERLNQERR